MRDWPESGPTKKANLRWADIALRFVHVGDDAIKGHRSTAGVHAEAHGVRHAATTVHDSDTELDGIHWDDVVDVVCIGRGAGVLAAVIGASRGGMTVLLANAGHSDSATENEDDSLAGRLGVADSPTVDYLNALTEDVGPLIRCGVSSQLPLRTIDSQQAESRRSRIATFVGSALRGWANRCLASPYGLLYTNLAHSTTVTYASAGETVEATVVGMIDVENGRLTEDLDEWLKVRADELGLEEDLSNSLQRLVFDGGRVVGVIVDTSEGARAVRAESGVVMQTCGSALTPNLPTDGLDDATSVTVALVSRAASRFVRLELLATRR